ncbi:unnamed protein product [Macrosiphum euphorbiae]|uniref:Uncharacterized protein n=1 Tax=Macrosiphum euphorbiae TaxID=13131 RepID=A0AAV0WL37_9HEMI|nr:unnamed protein product [Macrosiphum euphorbiae]
MEGILETKLNMDGLVTVDRREGEVKHVSDYIDEMGGRAVWYVIDMDERGRRWSNMYVIDMDERGRGRLGTFEIAGHMLEKGMTRHGMEGDGRVY